MNASTHFQTSTHHYILRIREDGLVDACYRPKNEKTGLPWQTERQLRGRNAWVFSNHKTGEREIRFNLSSTYDNFLEDGRWTSIHAFFRSESDARAAINQHAKKVLA